MITLKNVTKVYGTKTKVNALRGIDLNIKAGEIFGIIGKSGAGKSTLVRCINMLERPTSGHIIIDERDMTSLSDSQLRQERKSIGMIFQHFNLLSSRTVFDNIAFPLELTGTPKDIIANKVEGLLELLPSFQADKNNEWVSPGLWPAILKFSYVMKPLPPWIRKRRPLF